MDASLTNSYGRNCWQQRRIKKYKNVKSILECAFPGFEKKKGEKEKKIRVYISQRFSNFR